MASALDIDATVTQTSTSSGTVTLTDTSKLVAKEHLVNGGGVAPHQDRLTDATLEADHTCDAFSGICYFKKFEFKASAVHEDKPCDSDDLGSAFDNSDTSGFYGVGAASVSSSGSPIEWMDWGTITDSTGSDIVGNFTFGYGTSVTDVSQGGSGASAQLRFYDGITGFCSDSGAAPTASFSFTGLPGASPGTSVGWLITVDLTGGFEFFSAGAGNAFGFGFTTQDDVLGDGTTDTGPLLCYAGDPFGPNADATTDPDTNGQLDVYDQWEDSPQSNICLGSFFFGGYPQNFSSWYLSLMTADTTGAASASSSFRNGGSNPGNYQTLSPPALGGAYQGTDEQTNGGFGVLLVGYSTPLSFPTAYGQLLVNVADPGGDLLAGFNGPYLFEGGTASITIPVPIDLCLEGFSLATQTLELGGGIQLHNAQDWVVGF